MASFQKYKTKDGDRWKFQFYGPVDPKSGKRKPSTRRGFKTKKEAQQALKQIEEQLERGMYQTKDITYQQVFDEWWGAATATYKPSTISTKHVKFEKHILPYFGNLKIDEISRSYCQKWVSDLAKKINSANDAKIQANLVFKYALKEEYIFRNPMDHVVVPKNDEEMIVDQEEKKNFWEKNQMTKFLDLAKENMKFQDYVMFYLMFFTGMRKGELAALKWNDINLEGKSLRVNKTLFFKDGQEIIQTTKKYSSKRTISIGDKDVSLLRKWRTKQRALFLSDGITSEIDNVITRSDMRPIRLAYPNDVLNKFIATHKLKRITIHGIRHTHASLLFEAGASLKEVQARLGHKDIQTTMNIYTHVTSFVAKKTSETFHDFMESK